MSKLRLILLSCFFSATLASSAFGISATKEVASDLLIKMQNVLNSKNPKNIQAFFEYYSLPEARFIRTRFEIDPNDPTKQLSSDGSGINQSRGEYIEYLKKWVTEPEKYFFALNITDFKPNPDGITALISYHVDETVLRIHMEEETEIVEKALLSTNCNLTLSVPVSEAQIQGLNCVEKIARKRLESAE